MQIELNVGIFWFNCLMSFPDVFCWCWWLIGCCFFFSFVIHYSKFKSIPHFLFSPFWEIQIFSFIFVLWAPSHQSFSRISMAENPVSVKIINAMNSLLLHHITKSLVPYKPTEFHSLKQIARQPFYFNKSFGGTRLILANELADIRG